MTLAAPPGNPTSNRPTRSQPVADAPARPRTSDPAALHAELHAVTVMPADEATIREAFRKRIMDFADAVGVAHIIRDKDGDWDVKPTHSSGRVPRRSDFVRKFGENCEAAMKHQSIQIVSFLGLQAIFAPVKVATKEPEVMLVLAKESTVTQAIFVVETALEYYGLWVKDTSSDDNSWKLTSLAALIELVSNIERSESLKESCEVVANDLVRYLPCSHVGVGVVKRGKMRLLAISGENELQPASATFQMNETVLHESWMRDEIAIWTHDAGSNEHLLLAHEQLAREMDYGSVVSVPLQTPDEEVVGSILLGCEDQDPAGQRLTNFLRAAAPRIASAIHVVNRAEVSGLRRLIKLVREQSSTIRGRVWWGVAAAVLAAMFVRVPYRVRCGCELQPTTRRYVVAPFDGLLEENHVEAGELVDQGSRLANMDGQELRYRMASITADLAKAKKQSQMELTRRNVTDSIVAELEATSLTAERDLLSFQQNQIHINSPINGMVLSTTLEHKEGASVTSGQTLFEIGPLDKLTVEVAIPAEEVTHVHDNCPVRIWIDGFESQSFAATVESIAPRSELREARNMFVAEITIVNPDQRLRPGMKGNVRIDCARYPLGWNLFHKPWNFLVTQLTWW